METPSIEDLKHIASLASFGSDMANNNPNSEDADAAEKLKKNEQIVERFNDWLSAMQELTPMEGVAEANRVLNRLSTIYGVSSEGLLTISTEHISQDTAEKLNEGIPGVTYYDKGDVGWFIHVGLMSGEVPEDLAGIVDYARGHKFSWVCLDRDYECISELPTYKWD